MPAKSTKYKRVLLKLSGEALMGDQPYGIDPAVATQIAKDIGGIQALGVELKDPATGLLDFRAMRAGRAVYLCWRYGEPRIGFWHPLDTGIAGRQPLKGEE